MKKLSKTCRILSVLFVFIFMISTTSCLKKDAEFETADVVFATKMWSFDSSILSEKNVNFAFVFYSRKNQVPFQSAEAIDQMHLSLDGREFPCTATVNDIVFQGKEACAQIDGHPVYRGEISCSVSGLPNAYAGNALLVIKVKDGRSFEYRIGSVATQEENLASKDDFFVGIYETVIVYEGESIIKYGAPSGVIVSVYAPESITVTAIDFGTQSLGVDSKGIRVLSLDDYNTTFRQHADNRTLDELFPGAYDPIVNESPTNACNVELNAGQNFCYIPITRNSEMHDQVESLFVNMEFTSEGKSGRMCSYLFPFLVRFNHSEDQISRFFADASER